MGQTPHLHQLSEHNYQLLQTQSVLSLTLDQLFQQHWFPEKKKTTKQTHTDLQQEPSLQVKHPPETRQCFAACRGVGGGCQATRAHYQSRRATRQHQTHQAHLLQKATLSEPL